MKTSILFLLFSALFLFPSKAESVQIPINANCVNVKDTLYGAKGDGITDDTEAIKRAITVWQYFCGGAPNNFRFLYFPNGTYLVSAEIYFMRWLTFQGESQAGTIIKLKDKCPGYQDPALPKAVVRCRYTGSCTAYDGDNNSSFGNYIQNMTVNTGKGNPGAIGIRYNNHNQGAIRKVTIESGDPTLCGVIGLDMAETEFGPGLVKDVTVIGFDKGIVTPGAPSNATFENITVKNQKVVGFENSFPVSIHNFNSDNQVTAIKNTNSTMAQLVLVKANLIGGDTANSAINVLGGTIYARDITTTGYGSTIDNKGIKKKGTISEYIDGDKLKLFPSKMEHLKLPIEDFKVFEEPISEWRFIDPSAEDDTQAIQDAIDSGAKTLYLKFGGNYTISNTIYIRGNVRRILGFGGGIGASRTFSQGTTPMFVVQSQDSLSIEFFHTAQYPEPYYNCFQIDTNKPVLFLSVQMSIASGTLGYISNTENAKDGKLFFEDTHERLALSQPMNVWMRHYNPENNPAGEHLNAVYLDNPGGKTWVLGMKTEGLALHARTTNGGKTEILGGFFRDHIKLLTDPAYFETVNSQISASYYQYDWSMANTRYLVAKETRDGVTQQQLYNTGGSRNIILYSGIPTLQTPYNEHTLPCIIEAEDFDSGGNGNGYLDIDSTQNTSDYRILEKVDIKKKTVGSGYFVSNIKDGEWLAYSVKTPTNTRCNFDLWVSSTTVSKVKVEIDNASIGIVDIPNTYGAWQMISIKNIVLNQSNSTEIKIFCEEGEFNFDYIDFELETGPVRMLKAKFVNPFVQLDWLDESTNELGIIIERKIIPNNYEVLDTVPANTVTYKDYAILSETDYAYRIASYNNVNKSLYSNAAVIGVPVLSGLHENYIDSPKIFPNPSTRTINVKSVNIKTIEIYSVLGEKVYSNYKVNSDLTKIDIDRNGVFLVKSILNDGRKHTELIIISSLKSGK